MDRRKVLRSLTVGAAFFLFCALVTSSVWLLAIGICLTSAAIILVTEPRL